jgi:hypothetical protein
MQVAERLFIKLFFKLILGNTRGVGDAIMLQRQNIAS